MTRKTDHRESGLVVPSASGFTLIELIIAIAILGILTALAYPSYVQYVEKSRRSDIQSMMGSLAQQLERGYSENGQYQAANAGTDVVPGNKHYQVDIALNTISSRNVGYTITATARTTGAQTGDTAKDGTSCTTLTLNQAGSKTPASCWPT